MKKYNDKNNNNIIMDFKTVATLQYIDNTMCFFADAEGIEDIKTCSINEFKYLLQLTGSKLFPKNSKILKIENNIFINGFNTAYNMNMYDLYKLYRMYEIYILLSHKYNKLIHLTYYGYLINITPNNISDLLNKTILIDDNNIIDGYYELYNNRKLNNIRIDILKGLKNSRNNEILEKAYQSGGVGLIALANHEIWENETGSNNNNNLLSVDQLPQLQLDTKNSQ